MKTILLIDNSDDLKVNKELLESAGYEVHATNNGKIGIVLAIEEHPDLIISEIDISGINGYGVMKILKMNHETLNIPFIFLTSKADKKDIRKGMNLGADDYITKPSTPNELLEAVKARLTKIDLIKSNQKRKQSDNMDHQPNINVLENIIEKSKKRTFKEKQTIYTEGDKADYLYYLLNGEVKTVKTDIYGKAFVNDVYGPGEYIGCKALLLENEYTESAVTLKESELALITKQDFWVLLRNNHHIATMFIKMLAKNLSKKGERLLQLAYTPVRERVADALLQLKKIEQASQGTSAKIKISREDIASLVGTVRVSLNKVIAEFKQEGIIDTDRKNIIIQDEIALKKVIQH